MTWPNAQEIAEALSLNESQAETILKAMDLRGSAMKVADFITGGHGVECMRSHDADDPYFGDIVMEYVNTGDMYAMTLIFDVAERSYVLTDYAAWLQRWNDAGKGELHA